MSEALAASARIMAERAWMMASYAIRTRHMLGGHPGVLKELVTLVLSSTRALFWRHRAW